MEKNKTNFFFLIIYFRIRIVLTCNFYVFIFFTTKVYLY